MCVLDTKRIYLASKTNRDFASVLEAISSNRVKYCTSLISKGGSVFNIGSSMYPCKASKDQPTGYLKGRLDICTRWTA